MATLLLSMTNQSFAQDMILKCHVSYLDNKVNKETIVQYKVDRNKQVEFIKQLSLQTIFGKDGKTEFHISNIFECIESDRPFLTDKSRKADNETPQ
jgi:hypothetical protein